MIIYLALGLLVLGSAGYHCWRAGSGSGRQSRLGWLLAAAETALLMVMVRLLLPWSVIPPVLWLLPMVILAVAAALVVRRWSKLHWLRPDRRPAATIAGSGVEGAVIIALGFLMLG